MLLLLLTCSAWVLLNYVLRTILCTSVVDYATAGKGSRLQAFLDILEVRSWINARNIEECMKWVDHKQPLMNYLQLLTACVAATSSTRYKDLQHNLKGVL